MRFWEFTYHSPWMFCLFALLPIFVWLQGKKSTPKEPVIKHSGLYLFGDRNGLLSALLRWIPFILRMLALSLIIIALARPQKILEDDTITEESIEGIDIVLSLDISESMKALDFKPDRLGAAKKAAKDFIEKRPRIVATFYSFSLSDTDWGQIIQPRKGGGKTTSVSIKNREGILKMYSAGSVLSRTRATPHY